MKNSKREFQREFQIFKAGATDRKVTILSVEGEPFNRTAKITFYQLMGYSVYDIHDNLIPQQKTNNPIK